MVLIPTNLDRLDKGDEDSDNHCAERDPAVEVIPPQAGNDEVRKEDGAGKRDAKQSRLGREGYEER